MNTDVGDQIESERELRLRAEKSASHKDELYAKTLTELKKIESGIDFTFSLLILSYLEDTYIS